jgi:phosphoribosyl-ATP pyrophosphohydrolase/phosphoribosyl-AMP cyclohydrolase
VSGSEQVALRPVVVQDAVSGRVLMLAYANDEAVAATHATGRAHFYSRSREELWDKGATSGQVLWVRAVHEDCDGDALLYLVDAPRGACHTGQVSCFGDAMPAAAELGRLWQTVAARLTDGDAATSYTRRLAEAGVDRVLRKIGEESAEFIVGVKNQDADETAREAADVLYHLWVALAVAGVPLTAVTTELERRRR